MFQKGHPTIATLADLILRLGWKLKVLVAIGLNRLFG